MTTDKLNLLISFSGGKTSCFMTWLLLLLYGHKYNIRVIFANTGCEDERTLRYVRDCSIFYGFHVVWVEAVVHFNQRKASTHRIVTFDTASRNAEPYEQAILKYGIPNKKYPHCTRELKKHAIKSYAKSIGWDKCLHAVGIRKDEEKRRSKKASIEHVVYPLMDWEPTTKQQVLAWHDQQPIKLSLKEYEGNCIWCWKKNLSKLVKIANEQPSAFDFPNRMEREHGTYKDGKRRVFFRENRSTADILLLRSEDNDVMLDDITSGCGESCEPF